MTIEERKHREVYEGVDRRVGNRRGSDRRKSGRLLVMLKYLAVVVLTAILLKILGI
jgi:hypothetical protein